MNTDLAAIQGEVRRKFRDGKSRGETDVEITSRLVWLERQKLFALCHAMEEIFKNAATALELERETSRNTAVLLQWYKPL